MDLNTFFANVYWPAAPEHRSVNTYRLYQHSIRSFGRFLERRAYLSDLNASTVLAYLEWLDRERHLSPHSINKDRNQLLAIANFAFKQKLIDDYVEVPRMKFVNRPPRAFRVSEIRRLLESCGSVPGVISGVPASDWWEAFVRVVFETGLRTGAVLQLRWQWLDWKSGRLNLPSGAIRRSLPMTSLKLRARTLESLRRIAEPRRAQIFERDFCIGTFYNRYKRILRHAELPKGRKHAPQCIRRSHASYLEAAGGNATASLSHTKRVVTKRSYLDPSIVPNHEQTDLLPEI